MLVGLVFFVSLLTAAALLALVWAVRALWARLTGQPVMPWAMRMSPRAGWQTVYRSGSEWMAQRPQRAYGAAEGGGRDRKSTRLNSSHSQISYAVFCLKKKKE